MCNSENRFKSTELNNNKKLYFLQSNNINSNYQNLSNGEASESQNNKSKNNDDIFRKKLLLIPKKEKKIFGVKINNNKRQSKSETSKNIQNLMFFNDEEKIKKYKNKFNQYTLNRRTNKSKTIFPQNSKNLPQSRNNNFFKFLKSKQEWDSKNLINQAKTPKNDKLEKLHIYNHINKKTTFSNFIKKNKFMNNNLNTINSTKINIQFPSLGLYKPIITDKQDITINLDNRKNLYKSVNIKDRNSNNLIKQNKYLYNALNTRDKNSDNSIKDNKFFLSKKSFNIGSNILFKQNQIKNENNEQKYSKFYRKQTINNINTTNFINAISNKLLKNYKINNNKKNNFLIKLKKQLQEERPKDLIDNWKFDKKNEELTSSLSFMKDKINTWTSLTGINNLEDEQKIIFNGEESKYTKQKEKKYIKRIVIDFIKKISSPNNVSIFYYHYHKGIIEKNILLYLKEKFFDISLPSYLFENENKVNKIDVNKIDVNQIIHKKNIKKTFKRQKTIDSRKRMNSTQNNNISPKRGRRFSCFEPFKKKPIITNNIKPLMNVAKKKYIRYFYFLDMDLDNGNNDFKNDEKNSFLPLLRGNLNNPKIQDLLINKFISISVENKSCKNKVLSYNKKNSIKNNLINNKNISGPIKNNKIFMFKNNFFSRNEIKRSTYKIDDIKKRKSLLEYNLLFDPNLTGYNNLITESDIIFEPNMERTTINKRKIKELRELKNKQITSILISSGGIKTDKNIIVMKTLDLKNKYNHKNKGNINSLTSSIKDCNYDSFVKFYRLCNCGPNAIDKDGNSLLSLAVKSSCLQIVNFLLDEKANPNLQNVRFILYNKYYIL